MDSGLSYEAEKLAARLRECEEAFEALKAAAEECRKALMDVESGSAGPGEAISKLSSFLEALSKFEHELSHLAASASTILLRLSPPEGG
ncbi:hypothetical protein DRO33_05995 [Candidatus Bathyarchaeota archaeon]|nr:MAG: hypothetical protein DRO33_05995 [Candidatus Bathyarchaeota archaeon]